MLRFLLWISAIACVFVPNFGMSQTANPTTVVTNDNSISLERRRLEVLADMAALKKNIALDELFLDEIARQKASNQKFLDETYARRAESAKLLSEISQQNPTNPQEFDKLNDSLGNYARTPMPFVPFNSIQDFSSWYEQRLGGDLIEGTEEIRVAREFQDELNRINSNFWPQDSLCIKYVYPNGSRVDQENISEFKSECQNYLKSDFFSESGKSKSSPNAAYDTLSGKLSDIIARKKAALIAKDKDLEGIESNLAKYASAKIGLDSQIYFIGIPLFAAVVVSMMIVPKFYAAETQKIFFDSPVMLNLFTVFILTMVIIILATTDKIPKESIGTLLGGIAGYVLGSTKRNSEGKPE